MNYKYHYLVFIGRFQPFHNGHKRVIARALELSEKVIVLVGSANSGRTVRNPFTFEERREMIAGTFFEPELDSRVIVKPLNDIKYNDAEWIANTQKTVKEAILVDANPNVNVTLHGLNDFKIGLIGFSKDGTSYYLKLFPQWGSENVDQKVVLSATDLRQDIFTNCYNPVEDVFPFVPESTKIFLNKFTGRDGHNWNLPKASHPALDYLINERNSILSDREKYGMGPFVTVDNVVVQSGHILLVTRKNHPGKDKLALPGGFLELDETLEEAAVRELKEETRIADNRGEMPPAKLHSFITGSRCFDDPNRSDRYRIITHAFYYELPNSRKLFKVRGDDDASKAHWYPLGTLKCEDFYEDHYFIIKAMVGGQ